jgi:hypothetical protein
MARDTEQPRPRGTVARRVEPSPRHERLRERLCRKVGRQLRIGGPAYEEAQQLAMMAGIELSERITVTAGPR